MKRKVTQPQFIANNLPRPSFRSMAVKLSFVLAFFLFSFSASKAQVAFGVTADGKLVSFDVSSPGTLLTDATISGIAENQVIGGLDFRPATGQLYALGYEASTGQSQLYIIKTTSGIASPLGSPLTLATGQTAIGFDFNPTVDRIRVTLGTNSYRLNPNNGALVATDGSLAYAPADVNAGNVPMVFAVAYTNSFGGAVSTTLYFYDYGTNTIGTVNPPNAGTLNTVGASGIAPVTSTGIDMDILSNANNQTNTAYLTANVSGTGTNLYTVNLASGGATLVGQVGTNLILTEMSLAVATTAASNTPIVRLVYAVAGTNLISFNSNAPGTILSTVPLTGIAGGQVIEGLDFRPATGELFALGYTSATGAAQVYTINTVTAAATAVGSAISLPSGLFNLSFDFNPMVDRIRLITNTGMNYRLNPNDGSIVATDTNLSYAATDVFAAAQPNVFGVAYSNNLNGAASTQLFYYDINLDQLATTIPPASPNSGQLNSIGYSGLVTQNFLGQDLDIYTDPSTSVNSGYFSANVGGGVTTFFDINLATGAAQSRGLVGSGILINDFAVSLSNLSLPVTFSLFTAAKTGATSVLNWTTATEVNNSYFVVERSSNGTAFKAIGSKISSKALDGNSTLTLSYGYTDATPLQGANYYRLLQVDKDGRQQYSQVVQVNFDGTTAARMYPNPVKSLVNFSGFMPAPADVQVSIADGNGRVVLTRNYSKQNGNWNIQLNVSGLPNGMYFVQLYSGKSILMSKSVYKN